MSSATNSTDAGLSNGGLGGGETIYFGVGLVGLVGTLIFSLILASRRKPLNLPTAPFLLIAFQTPETTLNPTKLPPPAVMRQKGRLQYHRIMEASESEVEVNPKQDTCIDIETPQERSAVVGGHVIETTYPSSITTHLTPSAHDLRPRALSSLQSFQSLSLPPSPAGRSIVERDDGPAAAGPATPARRDSLRGADGADGGGADECVVCCEAPANAILIECGHSGVCATCAARLWQLPVARRRCPLCRLPFAGVVRVISQEGNLATVETLHYLLYTCDQAPSAGSNETPAPRTYEFCPRQCPPAAPGAWIPLPGAAGSESFWAPVDALPAAAAFAPAHPPTPPPPSYAASPARAAAEDEEAAAVAAAAVEGRTTRAAMTAELVIEMATPL